MIKVREIAYGRLRAPDLSRMEEFLTHFGLIVSERTPNALYMRGSDSAHHIHVTELGDPRLVGFAYEASNEDDLHRLTRIAGASQVEPIDEPGGGRRVRLTEPNGYQIEVVYGIAPVNPIPIERQPANSGAEPLRRAGSLYRPQPGPTPVKRIAHAVLSTPRVRATAEWFQQVLGLIPTDEVYLGGVDGELFGSFCRVDRGDDYVDHHALFCIYNPTAGLNHLSFEVPDVDAVMIDHQYLRSLGKYDQLWGVGRHLLGSQVFDYWADPWGRIHEHWADGDRLNAVTPTQKWDVKDGLRVIWGEDVPDRYKTYVRP
jgi:catechol 2,3-dioxygenase-like lactoylglutathione lyase family enzyme